MNNNIKPGYQTSEFWGKVIVQAASFASAIAGALPPDKAAYVIGGVEALYAISRSVSKAGGNQ